MRKKEFTLSIETAVQGGSVSLLRDTTELDCWIGTQEISKSEDVLEEIKNILERNDLEKSEIKKIVVSTGPGSYTGVRIGVAIGYGLKTALGCQVVGVSVLDGMLMADTNKMVDCDEEIIAIPIGSNQICWQNCKSFRREAFNKQTQLHFSTIDDFLHSLHSFEKSSPNTKKKIILHRKLYLLLKDNMKSRLTGNYVWIDAGEDIAALIGMFGASEGGCKILSPIYVRDSRLFGKV
jgi:tRNA threonylcarbamoyl adenosine modification protein YeaZ